MRGALVRYPAPMSVPLPATPAGAAPLLTGIYRPAYVRSTRGAMLLVTVMALAFVWWGLSGFIDGWMRWVALGMGPYLLYVNWTTAQLLRQPPQLSAQGVRFMEHDPLAYRAVASALRWENLKSVQWTAGRHLRRVLFQRHEGEAVRLTLSSLENEQAFTAALRAQLEDHGIPMT